MPRNRFGSATVVFQLFQNEGQIDARVEQLHTQLIGLDTAVAALFYDGVLRPIVAHRETFMNAIQAVRQAHEGQEEARKDRGRQEHRHQSS